MNADAAARAIEDMVERFGPARTAARLKIPQATLAAIIEGAEDVSEELAETVEEWVQAEQEQQEQRRHADWVTYHRRCEYGR